MLASRMAGLAGPLDEISTALDDPAKVAAEARHARDLGMTGKLCIHLRQVPEVLRAFAPSATEVARARRVLASGEGVAKVDGSMVDEPVRMRARAILARADE